MKTILLILTALCIALYIAGGIFATQGNEAMQEKAVGFATLMLFVLIMPLFLYWRYSVKYSKKKNKDINP